MPSPVFPISDTIYIYETLILDTMKRSCFTIFGWRRDKIVMIDFQERLFKEVGGYCVYSTVQLKEL